MAINIGFTLKHNTVLGIEAIVNVIINGSENKYCSFNFNIFDKGI